MRRLARMIRALGVGKGAAATGRTSRQCACRDNRGDEPQSRKAAAAGKGAAGRGLLMAAFAAAVLCGLGTSCRRAAPERETRLEVRLQGGAGRDLTLYELRANTGTVAVGAVRLDQDGAGAFRFANDSLSLFVLQTEPVSATRAADGLENRLVLFPAVGARLQLTADYTDLPGSAHLTDGQGHALDSLNLLPFQRAQQEAERLNREAGDYWLNVRYQADAQKIYDSIVERLDACYRMQKTESLRLAAQYPHTLIPIYLAQLQFGHRPLFNPQDSADLRTMAAWAAAMRKALPGNPHVLRFSNNIERLEQLQRLQALQREQTRRAQDGQPGRRPSGHA